MFKLNVPNELNSHLHSFFFFPKTQKCVIKYTNLIIKKKYVPKDFYYKKKYLIILIKNNQGKISS